MRGESCGWPQVAKAPMPGARFRATAAAATMHDGLRAVMVFGGHHRCEAMADDGNPDDDGGCDEIAAVAAFFEVTTAPIYLYQASEEGASVDLQAAQAQAAIVSPLAAVSGYRRQGVVSSGGGFWGTKTSLPTARSDFHVCARRLYVHRGSRTANCCGRWTQLFGCWGCI